MADILITPASSLMAFTSSLNYKQTLTQEASGSLTLLGSGSTGRTDLFTINGNNGTLFSVSDDLSNSLFSVNTIAGLPVIEAFANNTVVMGQYGQNVLVVTGSRVGIGTATPSTTLHVSAGDSSRVLFGPNATWGAYLYVGASPNITSNTVAQVISTNGNLHLDSGTSQNTYINGYSQTNTFINPEGGSVSIGTYDNPGARLQVNTSSDVVAIFKRTANGASGIQFTNAGSNNSTLYGGYDSYALRYFYNTNEYLTMDTSGNLGIGTTSPSYKLHVNTTSAVADMIGMTNGTQTLTLGVNNSAGGSFLFENGNNALRFGTNGSERMRITNGGNVGIGTTSPATKLDVNGGIKATTIQLTSGAADGYVLTSDSSGNGSWQAASGGGGGLHILTTPISGWLYTNLITNNYTSPIQANTAFDFVDFSLFLPANNIRATELSLYVSTAAATTTNVKIVVFTDEDYGYPRTKIIESTSMSANTTGLKTFVTTYTFEAGKKYWLGYTVDTDDATLRLTGITGNTLYTRNGNAFITQNGMYFSAPYNSIPTTNTNALTKTNLNAAQILLTSA